MSIKEHPIPFTYNSVDIMAAKIIAVCTSKKKTTKENKC